MKIAPGSNPFENMGRIEGLVAAEMRTAGLTLNGRMAPYLRTLCLPNTRSRHGTCYLATAFAARRQPTLIESRITGFLETERRGPTQAMLCMPVRAAVVVAAGKVDVATKETADGGGSTDKAVEVPTRTVVARPRLPAAMASEPKPPKVVRPREGASGVARKDPLEIRMSGENM